MSGFGASRGVVSERGADRNEFVRARENAAQGAASLGVSLREEASLKTLR